MMGVIVSWWSVVLMLVCLLQGASFSWKLSSQLLSYSGYIWGEVMLLDNFVIFVLFMLMVCASMAFIYCFHYFGGSSSGSALFPLVVWFVGVMGSLVLSGSYLFSLVLWEYLGFVSFLLMVFYSSSGSMRAAVVTLVSSRFGDVGFFVLLGALGGAGVVPSSYMVGASVLFIILSKSASYPFVSWLLEAMRAPTPVSSLVHSSTLVAAGVWFLLQYGEIVLSSSAVGYACVLSCFLSMFISGAAAFYFQDLKKIVALSTCNNISWCLLFFVLGETEMCVYQLVTHGVCKCLLFMSVGDLMSSSSSSQSSVGVYCVGYSSMGQASMLGILVFSLCGIPYLGIFFSKHLFFSYVMGGVYSWFLWFILLLGFGVSYSYSCRLLCMLFGVRMGLSLGFMSQFKLIVYLVFIGCFMKYLGFCLLDEKVLLGSVSALSFLLVQVLGLITGGMMYFSALFCSGGLWNSWVKGCDWVVTLFYSMLYKMGSLYVIGSSRWESYAMTCVSISKKWQSRAMFSFGFVFIGVLVWGLLCCFA